MVDNQTWALFRRVDIVPIQGQAKDEMEGYHTRVLRDDGHGHEANRIAHNREDYEENVRTAPVSLAQ